MMGESGSMPMSSWKLRPVGLAVMLLAASACGPATHDSTEEPDSATSPAPAATAVHAGESAAHGHPASADSGMTLLAIMQRLGGNMTALTHGLMTQDTASVRLQAAAIAEHAPIAASDLERIKRALGADIAAFDAVDESVHVAAVALRDAAQAGRTNDILRRLHEVQRGCVSCHAQFRERLRTNRTSD